MDKIEEFLRKELRREIDNCKTKKVCKLPEAAKQNAVDEGVRKWMEGQSKASDVLSHTIIYAKLLTAG